MMSEEDRMRQELQRLQRQADEVTNESLESTRRMLKTAEETQDIGMKTMVELDEQGEKLEKIDENLRTIDSDMREAEKNLTGLEKFCGLCICSCKRRKDFEKTEQYKRAFGNKKEGHEGTNSNPNKPGATDMPREGFIQRINENDAREDEMDENLGQVAGIVGNLKSMALEMGDEVSRQNRMIDKITDRTMANETRIEMANKRATDILRK